MRGEGTDKGAGEVGRARGGDGDGTGALPAARQLQAL